MVVPSAAATAPRSRNIVPWIVGGAALLVLIVVGVLLLAGGGNTIEGSFSLLDSELGSDCQGSGGYSDIGPGTSVTVRNETGDTIGTGDLGEGDFAEGFGCDYPFTVEDVPNAKFYRVEVSHRGEVEYSHAEMEANDWEVSVSLGDVGS
jgi:hypothetical protein